MYNSFPYLEIMSNNRNLPKIILSGVALLSATVLSTSLFIKPAEGAISDYRASEWSQRCADNPSTCAKTESEPFRIACPAQGQTINVIGVHAGDGQTVYVLPHEGFDYQIEELNGYQGVRVWVTTHQHDISWVIVQCQDGASPTTTTRPTNTQSPTATPTKPLLPTGTPIIKITATATPTDTPDEDVDPTATPTPTETPTATPTPGSNSDTGTGGTSGDSSNQGSSNDPSNPSVLGLSDTSSGKTNSIFKWLGVSLVIAGFSILGKQALAWIKA